MQIGGTCFHCENWRFRYGTSLSISNFIHWDDLMISWAQIVPVKNIMELEKTLDFDDASYIFVYSSYC